tara:strand:- start:933 stop:1310 length:378 start_codon:yes stop_codon:yes gene_type:complete
MIVHSNDGLDELSIFDITHVIEINGRDMKKYTIDPRDYFMNEYSMSDIIVNNATESLDVLNSVVRNEPGAARDIALLNAAALIYISGITSTIADGIKLCENALESKKVYNKIKNLITYTNTFNNA